MNTNDHDFIIKTVVEFYSEEEINSAQHLLLETCEETNLRMQIYRKDAAKLYCRDITNKFNEVGVHLSSAQHCVIRHFEYTVNWTNNSVLLMILRPFLINKL